MTYFVVAFSLLFFSENYKKLSFGFFLGGVGRFLNTHYDGFLSQRSPK